MVKRHMMRGVLIYLHFLDKKVEGVYNQFKRLVLMKSAEEQTDNTLKKISRFVYECECPDCKGKRLNEKALSCKINGLSIVDMCEMEFTKLRKVLGEIQDERATTIVAQLSALTGMIYIFDEPSTGMHPRDVHRMTRLLKSLRDKGNTVLVVEHDKDVIKIADEVIDVGPLAGKNGGQILFQGSYEDQVVLIDQSAITATGRSTVCTFLGFFDDIRKEFGSQNKVDSGLFSFNRW